MTPQAQDFLAESEAVHALVAGLDEDALARPTLFKGWTIADIIGHLHMWNWAADLALKDGAAFSAFYASITESLAKGGTFKAFERAWLGPMPAQELVARWQEFYGPMAERFAAADPSARVPWAGPSMSVRSSITARLMETWAHAQAIYDVLGQDRIDQDRIRNIVVLGINTYGWSFATRGRTAPAPMPHVRLTAPSGALWTYGEESVEELIEGSATAFCQVVAQTRNIADTSLTVSGPNATTWMAIAQCFAGPAQDPPAPGARAKAQAQA